MKTTRFTSAILALLGIFMFAGGIALAAGLPTIVTGAGWKILAFLAGAATFVIGHLLMVKYA